MRLLRIEWMKLKGNKSFWIFSMIFLVFLPFLVILFPSMMGGEVSGGVKMYPLMPKTAENTWYIVTLTSSYFTMFILAFILIYHIVNEFSNRTARQNVIDGFSRMQYLQGKLLLMLLLCVLATIYVFLTGLIATSYFGSIPREELTSFTEMMGGMMGTKPVIIEYGGLLEGVSMVGNYFLQILAYFSFAMFVSFLLRKGALAILVFFSSFLIEYIGREILYAYNYGGILPYLPLKSMSVILPNPKIDILVSGMSATNPATIENIVVVLIYTGVFIFGSILLFKKRDIS